MQPVDSTSRDVAGTFVVLFYMSESSNLHKLSAVKIFDQKEKLEFFIAEPPINGIKEFDWYRVDDTTDIRQIINYARGSDIRGAIYDMVHG